MEMTGSEFIRLPQQRVWEALNDPEVLKACIPGCEKVEKVSDSEFRMAMTAAVGPVKAKFTGKLLLSDVNPPDSYTLAFEGSGGPAGFGKGSSTVSLAPEADGTRLSYTARATVGGKLAQVGSRLIDGVAKKMAEDFFKRFNDTVAPVPAEVAEVIAHPEAARRGMPHWVWIAIAVAVAVVIGMFAFRAH
jgi:carbon monoxide dehydrogenase subunit G